MVERNGLTDEERAELEQLRAEKAARERAELERLRRQREEGEAERARLERDASARERGRRLMEPDDDLRMPLGQKVVILAVVLVALVWLAVTVLG